jgi:hypothetical protein
MSVPQDIQLTVYEMSALYYILIAVLIAMLIGGFVDGLAMLVGVWAKVTGPSRRRIRELEAQRNKAIREVAQLRVTMAAWERDAKRGSPS